MRLRFYTTTWCLVLTALFSIGALAQEITLQGQVKADSGEPLPGVSILIKGTSNGTSTDADGNFRIAVSPSSVLVFSFVGFTSQEVVVGNQSSISVVLRADTRTLDEIVVVGYGTQERKDVTSAISSVKGEEIQNLPVASPVALLQGRAAGVQIVQNNGAPGATDILIRVRGTTSINAGNNPLFVVDGLPFEGGTSDINPNDVESIEVLKDAGASAIYGSRAANGVVLITTKRGKSGKPAINFNYYRGVQAIDQQRLPEMMNSREFIELIQEQRANSTGVPSLYAFIVPDNGIIGGNGAIADTDWVDEVVQTGAMDNYEMSIRGGDEKLQFYLSGALLDQTGTLINSDYKRYTGKLNLDYKASERFKMGVNLTFAHSLTNILPIGEFGMFQAALFKAPIFPVYATDGSYFIQDVSGVQNPVGLTALEKRLSVRNRLLTSAFADYTILPGLTFRTSWSIDLGFDKFDYFQPSNSVSNGAADGTSDRSDNTNWLYEHTLNYAKTFDKHRVNALIGYSQLENNFSNTRADATDFAVNNISTLNGGTRPVLATSSKSANGLSSIFGRLGYVFNDKYSLEASVRRDGSSKFGKDNKYGVFPAASVGWQVGREPFFDNLVNVVSDFKIRASYGRTGNQAGIGNYTSQGGFSPGQGYIGQNGIGPTSIANRELEWETTDHYNVGTDLSFFTGRVMLNVDLYVKKTSNLLLNVQLPGTTGFGSILQNVGETENKGLEINLTTNNVTNTNLRWTSNFNISWNRNKIIKLDNGSDIITSRGNNGNYGSSTVFNLLREGESIGAFFGWRALGVYQYTADNESQLRANNPTGYIFVGGDMIFDDIDGNNVIDDRDRVIIGNAVPDFTGGFTNSIQYKNFELDVLAQFVYGNDVYNGNKAINESMYQFANASKAVLNRWRNEGDITDIPRADIVDPGSNRRTSTRFLEDGSYLRIKTATLAYKVPSVWLKRVRIDNLRLYFTAQNLFTFTEYSGIDPEANSNVATGRVSDLGFDYTAYPQYRTFLFGLNLGF